MVYADVNWIRLSALTQSEAERLEQMMKAHGRLVFAIAYSILRHPEDAEDVVQEVFLRVMRYRYRMAFIRDERTFLSRIAQRTALDHRRRRRETVSPEEADEPATPGPDYAQEQQIEMVVALMRTLPEEMRQVLELSQVEELNSAEIGRVLGIPPGTVRSRLSRAREMLKEKWTARTEVQRVRS